MIAQPKHQVLNFINVNNVYHWVFHKICIKGFANTTSMVCTLCSSVIANCKSCTFSGSLICQ